MAPLSRISSSFYNNPTRAKRLWKYWPAEGVVPDYSDIEASLSDLGSPTHPELEDQVLLKWGLEQSILNEEPSATVDVLHGYGQDLKWKSNVSETELEKILKDAPNDDLQRAGNRDMRYFRAIFVDTHQSMIGWLPGNFSVPASTMRALRKAGLSNIVLCQLFTPEGSWARMGNQRFLRHDGSGHLSSFEVAYRYSCGWQTGAAVMQSTRKRNQTLYICINYPPRALDRFKSYLRQRPSLAYRDFFLDALAADDCLKEWQFSIGERREMLYIHEKLYEDEFIHFDAATRQLHNLARHWLTLQQDCLDFQTQLDFLRGTYTKYTQILQDDKNGWELDRTFSTGESLDVLRAQCENYVRWITVYGERTNIRINLLFHLANQRESRTNTQIATLTAKVAEQTQRDSSSMITIAAVTMLFLPGTFVSAVLSTTFFDFGPDNVLVSRKWWILPAATIPLTVVTFIVWLGWQYFKVRRARKPAQKIA